MDRIPALHRHVQSLRKKSEGSGVIESFTTIQHPPAGFPDQPYTVALIRLRDGSKRLCQLTSDGETPTIGATVAPRMRRLRTMASGLFVNDVKYEVLPKVVEPILSITSYVLAISGPSGVGKTTIARQLLSFFSSYTEQVPIVTTRPKKKGDIDPYVHVSSATFQKLVDTGEIISWVKIPSASIDRRYGYRRKDIEAIWKKKKLPIVITEIHLLQGLVASLGRRAVVSCGLLPPGDSRRSRLSSLLHRLRTRGRDTDAEIADRMEVAKEDLQAFEKHPHLFDHLIVNDEIDRCLKGISSVALQR